MPEEPQILDAKLPVAGSAVPARLPGAPLLPATGREVAQFVAVRAAACVGADYSNLALLAGGGRSLRIFHGPFLPPELADRYTDVPIDAPFPIAAAARSNKAIVLPDLEAYRVEFPEILEDTVAAGVQATASIPLHRDDGTLVGVIGFAWTKPTSFDAKLRCALDAIADLCTATIERAERYDAEHQLIVELHRSLLGDLPVLSGIATSARYLPASRTHSVGGDWYEGLLLDRQRIALVVGDVTGHGVAAAADMALIRGMVTALLHSGVSVASVFSEVSGVLRQRPGLLLATAALAVVDVGAATLTYATAGHPPPVLKLADGRIQILDNANAPIIGHLWTRSVAEAIPFPPGSTLVMFTDGLVERRDRAFDVGVREVAASLAALPAHLTPREVTDALLAALVPDGDAEDDVAILVVENVA
ncbi:MAG: GAF domain-containing SpoIIE family protein phosphatase [Acidimicrobiales bacterium]